MLLDNYIKGKNVHMLGIGGISMSGIAALLNNLGYNVTGTNIVESPILDKLRDLGIQIITPHFDEGLRKADIIVYTAAISPNDPDMIKAKELNIPIVERADFLGEITKMYNKTIAISGMHGKTTTTSMIGMVLDNAKKTPTILVGGEADQLGGNYKIGNSDILVTEACEYVESFTKFFPYAGIILNIELEHLDYFKNLDHIKSAFFKFIQKVSSKGYIVVNIDDENIKEIIKDVNDIKVITFALKDENADWIVKNITCTVDGYPNFDVYYKNELKASIKLKIPGTHNIYNCLACIATCYELGVSIEEIKENLELFKGVKRRFEYKGKYNNIKVYDDYAHHPSEIKATLKALKTKEYNHSWCVFQPHTYTRTSTLFNDFIESFKYCDNVIVLDIYAAREKDTGLINSKQLVDGINEVSNNAVYADSFETATNILLEKAEENDIIITMGAGEAYIVGEDFLSKKN